MAPPIPDGAFLIRKILREITHVSDILLNFAAEIKQGGLVPPHSLIKITKFYAEKIVLSGVLAVDALVDSHGANHDIEHGW
jgi:hypothetical protein